MVVGQMILWALDLNYPLVLIFNPQEQQKSSLGLISEYVGFIGFAFLDFILNLALLYLFLKMGQRKLNLKGHSS